MIRIGGLHRRFSHDGLDTKEIEDLPPRPSCGNSFGLGLVVVGSAYGGDGHAKDCDCGTRGRGSGRSSQSLIA